jgi:hypothetical protein
MRNQDYEGHPVESLPLSLSNQVALAVENFGHELRTSPSIPCPPAYALGWIVANRIVANRYRRCAIDVVPVEHPDHGWDRFLITRRTACNLRNHERADSFGLILLRGDDAPVLAAPDGTVLLSLGSLLSEDPDEAIRRLLDLVPAPGLVSGDHEMCWHQRASNSYPMLYDVITHLLIENPGLVAAREIFVDDQQIGGTFHPLYIHTAGKTTGFTYDWFGVQSEDYLAYVRLHGHQAVYRTDRATWATPTKRLVDLSWSEKKAQISTWLRLQM